MFDAIVDPAFAFYADRFIIIIELADKAWFNSATAGAAIAVGLIAIIAAFTGLHFAIATFYD